MIYSINEATKEFTSLTEGLNTIPNIPDKVYSEVQKLFNSIFDIIGEMEYKKDAFQAGSMDTLKDTLFFDKIISNVKKKISDHKIKSFSISFQALERSITPSKFIKDVSGAFIKNDFKHVKFKGLLKKMFKQDTNIFYKEIDDESILVTYIKPYHNSEYNVNTGSSYIGSVTGFSIKFKYVRNDNNFEKEFKLENTIIEGRNVFSSINFI